VLASPSPYSYGPDFYALIDPPFRATRLTHVDLDGDVIMRHLGLALQQPLSDDLPHAARGNVFVLCR